MVGIAWPEPGLTLILLGECLGWLGCSLYWQPAGRPRRRRAAAGRPRRRAPHRRVRARPDRRRPGARLPRPCPTAASPWPPPRCAWRAASVPRSSCRDDAGSVAGWLFGEDQGRYLLAVRAGRRRGSSLAAAGAAGVLARAVGAHRRRRVDPRRRDAHIARTSCARRTRAGCRATWRPTARPDGSDLADADERRRDRAR